MSDTKLCLDAKVGTGIHCS